MKYFLKNWLPFGCVGIVLFLTIQGAFAVFFQRSFYGEQLLYIIVLGLAITIVDYLFYLFMNKMNPISRYLYMVLEYLALVPICIFINWIFDSSSLQLNSIRSQLIWLALTLGFIRWYVNRIFTRETEELNELLHQHYDE